MDFLTAMQTDDVRTENGMATHSSSGAKLVDLFCKMGGARQLAPSLVVGWFAEAFGESPLLATKAAFYHRDVRGGQGERSSFRAVFRWLCEYDSPTAIHNVPNVPFYGRWDDLFAALGTPVERAALDFYAQALRSGDALAAKWAPRPKNARRSTEMLALRRTIGLSEQKYRKLLAGNTDVVETKMSQREWRAINYSHVPSLAIKRYRKAFAKRDAERYATWAAELTKAPDARAAGVKVNAAAIYPHDIVRGFIGGMERAINSNTLANRQALEAQWKALPNYLAGSESVRLLPVVDVSGSMFDGGSPRAVDVSVALGLYLAERNVGAFKNAFIAFSMEPKLHVLRATSLEDRVREVLPTAGYNTDLEAVYRHVVTHARKHNVRPEEMPTALLMLSDMQFDQCVSHADDNALAMADRMFAQYGYARPNIVFWNLRTSSGVPVKVQQNGTALVSGFSPSIMSAVLGCKDMTPMAMMLRALNAERYDRVVLAA